MKLKLFIWISVLLLNLQIAFAQTGLFQSETGQQFAITGILLIVIIVIIRSVVKGRMKIKTF